MPYTIHGVWHDSIDADTNGVPFVNVNKSFADTSNLEAEPVSDNDAAYTAYYMYQVAG